MSKSFEKKTNNCGSTLARISSSRRMTSSSVRMSWMTAAGAIDEPISAERRLNDIDRKQFLYFNENIFAFAPYYRVSVVIVVLSRKFAAVVW